MLRIVDFTVKSLYSVMLSVGALVALACCPPVGLVLLLALRHHLGREANLNKKPRLQIKLS